MDELTIISDDKNNKGKHYWAKIPPTMDGMLGGFTQLSSLDVNGSRRFLLPYIKGNKAKTENYRALDCGAGIGRITKHLLAPLFEKIDMLDQNQAFLNEAKSYLGDVTNKVERLICSGIQDFIPDKERYNIIWVQWVTGYISDEEFVKFFERCKLGLVPNGLVFLKENISGCGEIEIDDADCTITRPAKIIRELIRKAGFTICKELQQTKFPPDLYEVRMFACRINSQTNK